MNWFYRACKSVWEWATTDPTEDERDEMIRRKTIVGHDPMRFNDPDAYLRMDDATNDTKEEWS